MFERFTDRARRTVVAAQEEARRLNHNYIGTEHLLLGLLTEPEGVAVRALAILDVTPAAVRGAVEEAVPAGRSSPAGHIPFTPKAKRTLERALREALALHHNYIGTEHILLGLMRVEDGLGAQALTRLGVDQARLRSAVLAQIGVVVGELPAAASAVVAPGGSAPVQLAWAHATALAAGGQVTSHHLLLALLADRASAAGRALEGAGVALEPVVTALRSATVAGSSDESEQDRGRRTLTVRLTPGRLQLECTDPAVVEAGRRALQTRELQGEMTGERDDAAPLGALWSALRNAMIAMGGAADDVAAADSPVASPRGDKPRRARGRRLRRDEG